MRTLQKAFDLVLKRLRAQGRPSLSGSGEESHADGRPLVTAQEIFDHVVTSLRAQGTQSTLGSTCRYRSPEGHKCAVGHLIPDHLYHRDMENRLAGAVTYDFPDVKPYLYATDLSENDSEDLLRSLQGAHDQLDRFNRPTPDDVWLSCFLHRARGIAAHFNLNPSTAMEAK